MEPPPSPVSPLSRASRWWWALLALGCWAAGWVFLFQDTLFSDFRLLPGDESDSRLILYIQEHWFQVFSGRAEWRTLGMFFPAEGSLGYSDTFFVFGLVHSLLRVVGVDLYVANLINYSVWSVVGFTGMLLLLRRDFGLTRAVSIWGAMLFICFGPILTGPLAAHPQMLNTWLLPWCVRLLAALARAFTRGDSPVAPPLIGAALLLAAILFNAFYTGWFFVLYLCLLLVVALVGASFSLKLGREAGEPLLRLTATVSARPTRAALGWARAQGRWLALGGLVFVLALTPFFVTYLPVLRETGSWGWQQTYRQVPYLTEIVTSGAQNWIWGDLNAWIIGPRGFRPETSFGLPLGSLLAFVAALGWLVLARRAEPASEPIRDLRFLRRAALTVPVIWLLLLNLGPLTPWRLVFELVPGAGAVRNPFRFNSVLALPIIVILAVGLDRLWRWSARPSRPALYRVLLVLGAGFLVAEQWIVPLERGEWAFDRHRIGERIDRLPPPPEGTGAEAFVALAYPGNGFLGQFRSALDAWAVAQRDHLPTLNGHSGKIPFGYRLSHAGNGEDPDRFRSAAAQWLLQNDYHRSILQLDLVTATWSEFGTPTANLPRYPLGTPIIARSGPRPAGAMAFEHFAGPGWSGAAPIGTWSDGERAQVDFFLTEPAPGALRLSLTAAGFVQPGHPRQVVQVRLNREPVATLEFGLNPHERTFTIDLPAALVTGKKHLPFEFRMENPARPGDLFSSTDYRLLGLSLRQMVLSRAE